MGFIAVYITFKDLVEAKEVISKLMNLKVIACANFFPIESAFWWKGKIENSSEFVALVKTRSDLWERVVLEVKKYHSYETPCIIKFDVSANTEYEDWVCSETTTE